MPTVKGIPGPYRYFFYSFDCNEPMHVHVQRERAIRKFWANPLALATNQGFSAKELNQIRKIIASDRDRIMEEWDGHCGKTTRGKN